MMRFNVFKLGKAFLEPRATIDLEEHPTVFKLIKETDTWMPPVTLSIPPDMKLTKPSAVRKAMTNCPEALGLFNGGVRDFVSQLEDEDYVIEIITL